MCRPTTGVFTQGSDDPLLRYRKHHSVFGYMTLNQERL